MELTQEIVDQFVGGQLSINNSSMCYQNRGEVSKIELIRVSNHKFFNIHLIIHFNWMAHMNRDGEWEETSAELSEVSPRRHVVSDVSITIKLVPWFAAESTELFPPNHSSNLDPLEVKNLELA